VLTKLSVLACAPYFCFGFLFVVTYLRKVVNSFFQELLIYILLKYYRLFKDMISLLKLIFSYTVYLYKCDIRFSPVYQNNLSHT
jgi:hypothetical protein